MGKYIGTIDQGTSSTRFMLLDQRGSCVAMAQKEHAQICPQPGWVEHSPLEIWHNTVDVIAQAMSKANIRKEDLIAIGITNQRETTLIWDRETGEPLYNALVWQDTRVAPWVEEYAADGGHEQFCDKTGLRISTYFSSLKLKWLLDTIPQARTKAENGEILFGTIDSWLLWNLSGGANSGTGGVHLTDVTNASRTQLMNLQTLDWDNDLLRAFNIPRAALPSIRTSSEVYTEARIAPIEGVPLAGILGDQQAALVGQTCFAPGEAKNTYGSGCFLLMNTGTRIAKPKSGLITTVAYQFGNQPAHYALEGSVAIAGSVVQWLRDQLGIIKNASEVEKLAEGVSDNGDVYFVPAFSGLFAPRWQPSARGTITGLTAFSHRGHIARAALESIAYQVREVSDAMAKDADIAITELRVDGGMSVNNFLMQFQADILNTTVVRPSMIETTALGAAYAAGLATGFWKDCDTLRENWQAQQHWQSQMPEAQQQQLLHRWNKCVERACGWIETDNP